MQFLNSVGFERRISMDKRSIFLTVDTECHDIERINQYIYGNTKKGKCGLELILEIGKEYRIPINFFFDVSECKRYGIEYAKNIINLIHSYDQPICFHLHPNYITGEDERSYLWEYTEEEQRRIILEGYEIYKNLCTVSDRLFFRAGRYGVNECTYKILRELGIEVVDFSYFYGNMKMCRVSAEKMKTKNANVIYNGITVVPNTSYIGLDLFGKQHMFLLNCANSTRDEFFSFIRKTRLNHVVFTMHSWDLMKKWFFLRDYVGVDKATKNKLIRCIHEAQRNGFEFKSVYEYNYEVDQDELLNLCSGFKGTIKSIFNNYIRFQKIAMLNQKYMIVYSIIYLLLFLSLIGVILLIV